MRYTADIAKRDFLALWEDRKKRDYTYCIDLIKKAVQKHEKVVYIYRRISDEVSDELRKDGFKVKHTKKRYISIDCHFAENESCTELTGWCEDGL